MWVIRDDSIRKRMNQYISDEELSDIYEESRNNDDSYVYVNLYAGQAVHAKVKIIKELFKRITPYKKGEWNPYPQTEPPKVGAYLVTVQGFERFVDMDYFNALGSWEARDKQVIAFRECPEPYELKETK